MKCKDCGYLSVRSALDSLVYPASEDARKYGMTRCHYDNSLEGFGGGPLIVGSDKLICYVGHPAFSEDMESLKIAEKVISKERTCPRFVHWIHGKTPKEHEDMTIVEQVKAEYSQQRQEEREWQQRVEALAETRHQEMRRDKWKMTIWALVIALASAIIGGLISRQWGPSP